MARSKKDQSMIVTALGVQMTIWQSLVEAVRSNGGSDEDIYRLATPEGRTTIAEMGRLITRKDNTEPYTEMIIMAGYAFMQVTYPDGSKLIELGEFEVDSDQSLTSKLEVCGFVPHDCGGDGQDIYSSWINQERFPFQQNGKAKIRLALINTGKEVQCEADFKTLMAKLGRKEGDHAMGIAVVSHYPDLRRELYMIMYGARGHVEDGSPIVLAFVSYRDAFWLSEFDDRLGCHRLSWALVAG